MIPLAEQAEHLTVLRQEGTGVYYLGLNLDDPIIRHLKVRQALAHSIDRQSIIEYLLHGQVTLATGLLPPSNWAYEKDVMMYEYNIEAAQKLLDQAGYPDPDGDGPHPRFTLTYKTSTNSLSIRIGEIIQAQLKEIGIEMNVESVEWATLLDDVRTGNFDIYRLSWIDISDPDIFYGTYHSTMKPPKGDNFVFYANPSLDTLLEQGRITLDVQKRREIYSRVQKILAEELPYIYLWYLRTTAVLNTSVKGFVPYPDGNFISFKDVWIEE